MQKFLCCGARLKAGLFYPVGGTLGISCQRQSPGHFSDNAFAPSRVYWSRSKKLARRARSRSGRMTACSTPIDLHFGSPFSGTSAITLNR